MTPLKAQSVSLEVLTAIWPILPRVQVFSQSSHQLTGQVAVDVSS